MDFQVGLKPHFRVEKIVHVLHPQVAGIQGLSMIKAIGTLSNFSRRAAFLNVSHCCGLIAAFLSN